MVNTKTILFLVLMLVGIGKAQAQSLEIPIEELPSESVIPALDSPVAVQNRSLSFSKRWQADLGMGWILDEAFYQNRYLGVRGTYHWNEFSGIGIRYMTWTAGTSDYANEFQKTTNKPDFTLSRGPEKGYAFSYENKFLYGKVSFTKNTIIAFSMLSQVELGMIQYGVKNLPFFSVGVGNNLFLTEHFGLNLMVRFMARQAPDPLSQIITINKTSTPAEGDFSVATKTSTGLDFGAIYLF